MNDEKAKEIIDVIIGQIFGFQNPYTLEQFAAKFAFDIKQTVEVFDYQTGESTWAHNSKSNKYVKFANLTGSPEKSMIPKEALTSIDDIIRIWQKTNITSAERYLNSLNVAKSDAVYGSQNVYRSIDVHNSKNIVYSESCFDNEYCAALQRSNNCVYSLRIDDCKKVSKSFQVSWSDNISNSFFIKDCSNISDCMFMSQVKGKRFCIANMQLEEAEYRKWEAVVKQWILTN
jgi:hypothetical protein